MKRRLLAFVFLVCGVAALTYAAYGDGTRFAAVMVGLVSFFAAATLLSRVATLSNQLESFKGKIVRVEGWGVDLGQGAGLKVDSVRALGAGLHIYFSPGKHLKIAQPRRSEIGSGSAIIADAAYVQWEERKITKPADRNIPALVLRIDGYQN